MVAISADAGGVAEELRRIHPCLKVRFAENGDPPYWCVFYESEDQRDTYLILTVQAHRNHSGVWEGLDHRVVDRIREIDNHGRSGYDYAKELETSAAAKREQAAQQFRDLVGESGEQAAFAVRKDRGKRYRGRAFVPRSVA